MEADEQKPLWRFVEKVSKVEGVGGTWLWKCKICKLQKQGTYTRVKAHLLKIKNKGVAICFQASTKQVEEMTNLEKAYESKLIGMTPNLVSLPSGPSTSQARDSDPSKKRKMDSTIAKAFDLETRKELDCIIARMFYTGVWVAILLQVTIGSELRCSNKKKKHVDLCLKPIRDKWGSKGVTIVTDGWSDPNRRPLINFMVSSDSGPMFIKAVDCGGVVKDKDFIAGLLREVIDEVGYQNVVQIITDNASNCKAAGEIIEGVYPHIYWTPCVVHTLNLALKNICAARNVNHNEDTFDVCHWITDVHNDVVQIKNFIMNHGMRLSMFMHFTPLKLLSLAETRFASVVIMLKRFKLVKNALEAMVVCDEWSSYRDDDQEKARFVRDTILSEDWWDKLNYILAFTTPIYDMIRACDTDKPSLHLVYEMWDTMIEKVKKVIYEHEFIEENESSTFYETVHKILVARWAKSNTPLHCLAHSLNPRFYSHEWLSADSSRVPPHRDNEVSIERRKCLKRLFPNKDEYNKAQAEYVSFSIESGGFDDPDCIQMRHAMDPKGWWVTYGTATPLLQGLAIRLLGQPTSSSCCERNWSTYSFIHSLKRNKLNPKRAEELVFIHNNLRLLSRKNPEYLDEKTRMWDVGGDAFGSLGESNILELAELSLDEPEMERVFFEEECQE